MDRWSFFADRSLAIGVAIPACAPRVAARILRKNNDGAHREQSTRDELLLLARRAALEMIQRRLSVTDSFQRHLLTKALRDSIKRNREYRALVTANRVAEEERATRMEVRTAAVRARMPALISTAPLEKGDVGGCRAPSSKRKGKKKQKQAGRSSDRSATRIDIDLATGHGVSAEKRRRWENEMDRVEAVAKRSEAVDELTREERRGLTAVVREAACVDVLKLIHAKLRLADADRAAFKKELVEEMEGQAPFFVENNKLSSPLPFSFDNRADNDGAVAEVLAIILPAMAREHLSHHDQSVRDAVECEEECKKGVKNRLKTVKVETAAECDKGAHNGTLENEQKTAETIAAKEHADKESERLRLVRARVKELVAKNASLQISINDTRKADEDQGRVESANLEKLNSYVAEGQGLIIRRRDAIRARDEVVQREQSFARRTAEATMEHTRQMQPLEVHLIRAQNRLLAAENALEAEMRGGPD